VGVRERLWERERLRWGKSKTQTLGMRERWGGGGGEKLWGERETGEKVYLMFGLEISSTLQAGKGSLGPKSLCAPGTTIK
jgi:hypothetical protein